MQTIKWCKKNSGDVKVFNLIQTLHKHDILRELFDETLSAVEQNHFIKSNIDETWWARPYQKIYRNRIWTPDQMLLHNNNNNNNNDYNHNHNHNKDFDKLNESFLKEF